MFNLDYKCLTNLEYILSIRYYYHLFNYYIMKNILYVRFFDL